MISLQQLRNEYLVPNEDPLALGFLSVFIGGSVIHQQDVGHIMKRDSDWDGVGIVRTKQEIISLLRDRRASLCALLGIVSEEATATTWEDALQNAPEHSWHLVRFSGWTSTGSKRTMKIWSQEHLELVAAYSMTCYLGVLSHKVLHNIQLNHDTFGPGVVVSPPTFVTDRVSIMTDFDILPIKTEPNHHGPVKSWPGIVWDLILTSRCVFECDPGMAIMQKTLLLSKWIRISNSNNGADTSHFIFRWSSFSPDYQANWIRDFELVAEAHHAVTFSTPCHDTMQDTPSDITPFLPSHIHKGFEDKKGPRFVFYHRQPLRLPVAPENKKFRSRIDSTTQEPSSKYKTFEDFIFMKTLKVHSAFSRNSEGQHVVMKSRHTGHISHGYIKSANTLQDEISAMDQLRSLFDEKYLQRVIALDTANKQVVYEYFQGKSLLDIRTDIFFGKYHSNPAKLHRWLLSIESKRAHEVVRAYRSSLVRDSLTSRSPEGPKLHRYFYQRLHNDSMFKTLYGSSNPTFLNPQGSARISPQEFLELPICVNNQPSGSLRQLLDAAEAILHPQAKHFSRLPIVYGLGDGHGGNVMVADLVTTTPMLRFIDYEVAGYNPILLDLAKPIYLDCFYNALWGDVLAEDLTGSSVPNAPRVHWSVGKSGIHIDYDLNFSFLDKALATTKFEFLICPILHHIYEHYGQDIIAESVLAHALFCCAVLTRDLSQRADVFYLNLAVGIELMKDFRGVIDRNFGKQSWPTMETPVPA